MLDNFQFAELAKYRKQHKNNQQAGSLITRLPAFFYACKCHFSRGCSNEPPLNTPRGNKVKLYQVQCSNESMHMWVLSKLIMELLIARGFKGKDGKTLDLDRKVGANTIYALNAYKKSRKMTQNGICDAATWKDLIAI